MRHAFPQNYGEDCVIIAIDKSLLPMVAGALRPFEQRYSWVSDEDYELGYNAFAQVQADMANNCLTELVESNNRIYRLLDTALNGAAYTAATDPETEETVVSPAIPAAPAPASLGGEYGMRRGINNAVGYLYNLAAGGDHQSGDGQLAGGNTSADAGVVGQLVAMQGILNAGLFGIGGQRATMADLVQAMRAGSEDDIERVTGALDILSGASSSATVFNTVRDLLTDTASVTAEGGILAVLIASTMSQAALAGLQGAQLDTLIARLDRVISSLDGGATPAPATNVISELQGVNEKLV